MGAFSARREKLAALAASAVMTLQFPVLRTLLEFRSDHLALTLGLAGLWALGRGGPRRWLAAGFLFAASSALTPKLVLLQAIAVVLHGRQEIKAGTAPRRFLELAAGALSALAVLQAACLAAGLDPMFYFKVAVPLHSEYMAAFRPRFGLAKALAGQALSDPLLLAALAGAAVGLAVLLKTRRPEQKGIWALSLFAVGQLLWVHYPWKQYVYVVLLAAAAPLAALLAAALKSRRRAWVWAACGLFLAASLAQEARRGAPLLRGRFLEANIRMGNKLLEWAPSGAPVAASPPYHPVFRKNATYFFSAWTNPGGPPAEEPLRRFPALADRLSRPSLRRQLEENPPGLVVPVPEFAAAPYLEALEGFLEDHAADYVRRPAGDMRVYVRTGRRTFPP
jgi:hypothetical protein